MSATFVEKLQIARDKAGIPFRITSGWRCKSHNEAVGGSKNSDHVQGKGADIAVAGSHERYLILWALIAAKFHRIGIGSNFIHAGDGDGTAEVIWTYLHKQKEKEDANVKTVFRRRQTGNS